MKTLYSLLILFLFSGLQTSQATDEDDFISALFVGLQIRTDYTEKVQTDGIAPSNLAELGIDESYLKTDLVEHIDIEPVSGAIMVGLAPEFGQNEWIAIVPIFGNFQVTSWTCQTTLTSAVALNSDCKSGVTYENLTQILNDDLFANTILQINNIKLNAAESLQTNLVFPQSMLELGVDEAWLVHANVSNVVVMPYFNTVFFALESVYGINQWISIRPRIRNGLITSWSCKTTLPSNIAGASVCSASVDIEQLFR